MRGAGGRGLARRLPPTLANRAATASLPHLDRRRRRRFGHHASSPAMASISNAKGDLAIGARPSVWRGAPRRIGIDGTACGALPGQLEAALRRARAPAFGVGAAPAAACGNQRRAPAGAWRRRRRARRVSCRSNSLLSGNHLEVERIIAAAEIAFAATSGSRNHARHGVAQKCGRPMRYQRTSSCRRHLGRNKLRSIGL